MSISSRCSIFLVRLNKKVSVVEYDAISMRSNELRADIVYLTPEDARKIISSKINGYPHTFPKWKGSVPAKYYEGKSRKKIERYKKWMLNGWFSIFWDKRTSTPRKEYVHPPIIFSADGFLYEGKHRIIALSEISDVSLRVPFLILRGHSIIHEENFLVRHSLVKGLPEEKKNETI